MKITEEHKDDLSRLRMSDEECRLMFVFDKTQKKLRVTAEEDDDRCEITLSAEKINALLGFLEQAFREVK